MSTQRFFTASLLGLLAALPVSHHFLDSDEGVALSVATAEVASGQGSRAYLHSFNLAASGVAIEGFSPVSYFEGRAERGNPLFAVMHHGVTYHLANAAQVETFKFDPDKYIPAYGGWCAFGMAVKDKFPIDPTSFKIVNGRLLFFLRNPRIHGRALWEARDQAGLLKDAAEHWNKVNG